MNKETHISICGIGPGNPDYISNIIYTEVEKADVLVGGKRQLSIFQKAEKEHCVFDGKTDNLKKSIDKYHGKYIVVLVSGDTGFYSLRRFIVEAFPHANIEVFPGISSFQYFYAKLSLGYEQAFLTSIHGIETDYIQKLKKYSSVFLLTDRKNNYKTIAKKLIENGYGDRRLHIGNNLSYDNEQIISLRAIEVAELDTDFPLCSVIIENPEKE
ncbi:MAG: precorrin-6y C5,15-methyltransferase (decarboxylating) subunit CbiE [Salinivirgaceae bacterium]|jgi:cobalt-precorrin-7 (C5)-methyltransferase|nr:precorrin-6y C5,15-methyltransferase (decarboxylating) subunit CbiE [Salinivirgaceae bacterium]